MKNILYSFLFTFCFSITVNAQAPRIIPVVFHILHQYGIENISDAQVYDAMRILNEDYHKLNADTALVIPPHQPLIGDCNIEFRLATKDPNGNCTNGIERIYSPLTNNADDNSKIDQWPRDKYLNIWTVKSLTNNSVGGYAYDPWTTNPPIYATLDGALMTTHYIGSIGTGSIYTSRYLTHVIGHYLSLLHLGGSTCQDGDGISDTPPTSWATVNCSATAPTYSEWRICDTAVIENKQNFMEGGSCQYMFTHGQATFVNQILNLNLAQRNNLWTTPNLLATGTDSASFAAPPLCSPVADFYTNNHYACVGGTVHFIDASYGATITNYSWIFSNGTPATSNAQNPNVTFSTTGWQQVSLTVSNTSGSNTRTITNSVYIFSSSADYWGTFTEDFETTTFDNSWITENKDYVGSTWMRTNGAGVSGTHSVVLADLAFNRGTIDAMISPSVNLSTCSSMTLQFKYACATLAQNTLDITEFLKIYTSTNCGATWTLRRSISGVSLTNNGYSLSFFIPNGFSTWTTYNMPINLNDLQQNVRFRFEYTAGDYSNAIYIDDINLNGTLGVNEIGNFDLNLNIFPNPSSTDQETMISYELKTSGTVSIAVVDLLGRDVVVMRDQLQNAGENKFVLDKTKLLPGIYLVKIKAGNDFAVKRMVIGAK